MQVLRILIAAFFALGSVLLVYTLAHPAHAAAGRSCGQTMFTAKGVRYRVLFAKNGAVQQYVIVKSSQNQERDHDALMAAVRRYGPEAVNAPPVRIVGFRPGGGGMMIPAKAIDSCGRVTEFR